MFIGREKELKELRLRLNSEYGTAILIYGKRRVGKSTLIAQAAKDFDGIVINHQCIRSTYEGNVDFLARSLSRALNLPTVKFDSLEDIFEYLGRQNQKILVILDEYQYLKQSMKSGEMDSLMQMIVDRMGENIKLILCGSYISIMKELMSESNPLFGRFSYVLHLTDMDYLDAAKFMNGYSVREMIEAYAVFGGSPYVLSQIDTSRSVIENIKNLILADNSILSTHIESVMLSEIKNSFDVRILEIIGNGRKKYSEILNTLNIADNGHLDKQLGYLLNMETIQKVSPINRKNDRKKTFYVISDNLMRFYFAFVFGKVGQMTMLGENTFFDENVEKGLGTFISLRFEEIVRQYFIRQAKAGLLKGIQDIGTYWYDDKAMKTSGQFDCALKFDDHFEIYEVKFYDHKMSKSECEKEVTQTGKIGELDKIRLGFVCSEGFTFETEDWKLIDACELYRPLLKWI